MLVDNNDRNGSGRTVYRYPAGLKGNASLWFWKLRDLAILGVLIPPSLLLAFHAGSPALLGGCFGFALLTARPGGELSVFDLLIRIAKYLFLPKVYVQSKKDDRKETASALKKAGGRWSNK